ncbi:MAG: hypothetical protein ACXVP8_09455, partial [Actinomycetota bacterium]
MTEGFEAPGGDQPPSRGRGRRRTYTVLAAVLLFVLASVVVVKAVAPALQDANERAATAEATRLLGFVRLPPGASRLGRVSIDALQAPGMGTPGAGYFVDLHQLWSVPGSMDDALSWIVAHLRPGLTSSGGASGGPPPVRTVAYS